MAPILLWIIVALVVIIISMFVTYFNRFVILGNRIDNSLSQIDVQLRKRADLVPNLINTVKGYVKHEKGVLTEVTKARTSLMSAKNPHEAAEADNMLTGALKSLFAVAENYPNLKASENFKALQDELSDTETKVAASRQFYNTNVLDLNNSLETIPSAWVGSMFGFTKEDFFKASEEEKADIKVKF